MVGVAAQDYGRAVGVCLLRLLLLICLSLAVVEGTRVSKDRTERCTQSAPVAELEDSRLDRYFNWSTTRPERHDVVWIGFSVGAKHQWGWGYGYGYWPISSKVSFVQDED